jgi:hypothetical protein
LNCWQVIVGGVDQFGVAFTFKLHWRLITETRMHPRRVVPTFNVAEHTMPCLGTGCKILPMRFLDFENAGVERWGRVSPLNNFSESSPTTVALSPQAIAPAPDPYIHRARIAHIAHGVASRF